MIFFNKFKETIEALRSPSPVRTIYDEIEEHGTEMRTAISGELVKEVANIGVRLAVLVPSSWLILEVAHQLTRVDYQVLGVSGIIVGYLINEIHSLLNEKLTTLPLHKLNPFFGNKIEETISALRS